MNVTVGYIYIIKSRSSDAYSRRNEMTPINTARGSHITIATVSITTEHGYFDERAPLGGVFLGTTTKTKRGVLVSVDEDVVRMMVMRPNNDFCGIVSECPASTLTSTYRTVIGADHLPVVTG